MKATMLASILLAGIVSAVEILPGGFVSPKTSKLSTTEKNSKDFFQIRQQRAVFVSPDADGTLSVFMKNEQVGRYTMGSTYKLYDLDNRQIAEGNIGLNQSVTIRKSGLKQGIYRFVMDSGSNSALVRSDVGFCCAEATEALPLAFIYHCPKVFFSVLNGRLKMKVLGQYDTEHVALTIWDANGKAVLKDNTVEHREIMVDIPIPEEQEGSVWSMILEPCKDKPYEDMSIAILEGAEPVVSLKPDGLVFPIVRQEHHAVGKDKAFSGIAVSQLLKNERGLQADFTFTPDGDCDFQPQKGSWKSGDETLELGFVCDNDAFVNGTFAVTITQKGKNKPIYRDSWRMTLCEGQLFHEVFWMETGKKAPVTKEDKERGYQIFQRAEPGFVRPTTTPRNPEICSVIKAETCPGLISAEFFALFPLKSKTGATIAISDLKTTDGSKIPVQNVEVLTARIWGQRIDWNSRNYITAPELLEKKDCVDLKIGLPQQYCIKLKVPQNAKPGIYKAMITLDGKPCIPYELTVDDFTLPEYNDITFGLYADGERWLQNSYTDDEIRAEMQMFRDYGMNALMVYPFAGNKIAFDADRKTWVINIEAFRHLQKIYTEIGFKGIQVISLQNMKRHFDRVLAPLNRPCTQEEYMAGFKAILETIRQMAREDNWGPFVLHTVDEPHEEAQAVLTRDTLKFIRENGFKTFCTCFDSPLLDKYFASWLDYRCYCNIAYWACKSQENTEKLRKNSLDAKANFWWYGSGCYTNGGLQQDCNVYSNRHMLGVFNWRSKATGAWTWTFLRAKGDVFNDFDHNDSGEAKDACICYPALQGNGLIDTLQWEGCREGIYDYRYIRLWDELATRAEKNHAKATLAQKSRKTVEAAISKLPWTCLQYSIGNQELRDLRKLIIAEIRKLK